MKFPDNELLYQPLHIVHQLDKQLQQGLDKKLEKNFFFILEIHKIFNKQTNSDINLDINLEINLENQS